MTELVEPLDRGDTSALAPGFVTSAAVLRHLQADPLLPERAAPADLARRALRDEYDRFDAAYRIGAARLVSFESRDALRILPAWKTGSTSVNSSPGATTRTDDPIARADGQLRLSGR